VYRSRYESHISDTTRRNNLSIAAQTAKYINSRRTRKEPHHGGEPQSGRATSARLIEMQSGVSGQVSIPEMQSTLRHCNDEIKIEMNSAGMCNDSRFK
jgi:hypothetical protein